MRYLSFRLLGKRIKAIKFFLKDPEVSKLKKALVLFGVLYLFMPIDIIPLPVPVFGVLDDLFLWVFILYYLRDELDKYDAKIEAESKPRRFKTKGRDIYESTGRELYDEEE